MESMCVTISPCVQRPCRVGGVYFKPIGMCRISCFVDLLWISERGHAGTLCLSD